MAIRYDRPIEDDIRCEIMQKLNSAAEADKIKILLAVESGSRSWGFASPDSDYDCRFIYVHKKDWYLSVFDKKDFIEYASDKIFDINGWDLRKFISHIVKSNAVMFEWLSSNEAYICNEAAAKLLQDIAVHFFNPVAISYHYLNLALKKYKEILAVDNSKLKNYFYVLRPLANLKYIENFNKMPYMNYFQTLAEIETDKTVNNEIMRLFELKKISDESYVMPRNTTLINYFSDEIKHHEERLKSMKFNKNHNYEQADDVFKKIIEMA